MNICNIDWFDWGSRTIQTRISVSCILCLVGGTTRLIRISAVGLRSTRVMLTMYVFYLMTQGTELLFGRSCNVAIGL